MELPRVFAEIDLDAIAYNVAAVRAALPAKCRILGVVKADAYGHGAGPIAAMFERCGVDQLGVGDSTEAIRLREWGIEAPIVVLGAVVESELENVVRHRITPTVHSPDRIETLGAVGERLGLRIPVHLLVDTGISLLGVTPARAVDYLKQIEEHPFLELRGVGSHLAAPADSERSADQLGQFDNVVRRATEIGIQIPLVHVAASGAIARYRGEHRDMVRVGGLLYGIDATRSGIDVKPALRLSTQIVHLRDVPTGTEVSYLGTHVTTRPTRLATIAAGYFDGLPTTLSNRAEVIVRGRRVPMLGRITMDYTVCDVSDVPGASVGDRVTILGSDGDASIQIDELARVSGMIPYEIPARLGPRVRRIYVSREASTDSKPVRLEAPRVVSDQLQVKRQEFLSRFSDATMVDPAS